MGYESIAMRPKAEWVINSEAMRARGIIVLAKFQLVGQISLKTNLVETNFTLFCQYITNMFRSVLLLLEGNHI